MVVGCHVVEEEVLVPEFIGLCITDEVLVTWSQTVVLARQTKCLEHLHHGILELESFFLVHRWRQVPALNISGDSCSHGDLVEFGVDLGEDVLADGDVPVVGLFGLAFDLVVLADEWFQVEAEDVVVLWSSGICAYRAVVVAESSHHDVE